jgi:nucleotide-binding universal stress UspA family protein
MFRTIMVPLDRTRFAEAALPTAIHLAQRHSADLLLVTVWQPLPLSNEDSAADRDLWKWEQDCREDDRRYMNEVARRVGRATGRTVSVRYLLGYPAEELAKLARTGQVDAAVVSVHARGPVTRTLLRSVTERLARRGGIPLFLIHPDRPSPEVAIAPRRPFQHVLLPLDGSKEAESALASDFLAGLSFRATSLTLLHVLPPGGLRIAVDPTPPALAGNGRRGERGAAEAYLATIAERLAPWGFCARTHVLTSASIARAISSFAEDEDVDLIAMATHGRGGLARMVPGSVADAVVRTSRVPTVLFPPPVQEPDLASRRGAALPW